MKIRTIKSSNQRSKQLTRRSRLYQCFAKLVVKHIPFIPSTLPYNITISETHKFIWFRNAKVGTRTILTLFHDSGVSLAAEHPYKCHYPIGTYQEYFKFGFVRNPYDRLVSCWLNKVVQSNYFNFKAGEHQKMQVFDHFIDFVSKQNLQNCDPHIRMQSKLLDLNNIDFVGRFEKFHDDLLIVCQKLDIEPPEIPQKNITRPTGTRYQDYYNSVSQQKVSQLYKKDLQIFGYGF